MLERYTGPEALLSFQTKFSRKEEISPLSFFLEKRKKTENLWDQGRVVANFSVPTKKVYRGHLFGGIQEERRRGKRWVLNFCCSFELFEVCGSKCVVEAVWVTDGLRRKISRPDHIVQIKIKKKKTPPSFTLLRTSPC